MRRWTQSSTNSSRPGGYKEPSGRERPLKRGDVGNKKLEPQGGESTRKKFWKIARGEKPLSRLKQDVKPIKRPVFYCAKRRFLLCRFHEIFCGRFPAVTAARYLRVKIYAVYTAIIWDIWIYKGLMIWYAVKGISVKYRGLTDSRDMRYSYSHKNLTAWQWRDTK